MSDLRVRLHGLASTEWRKKFEGITDPETKKTITERDWPKFEAILNYSDEQFRRELVPTYNDLLNHFSTHKVLAVISTLQHYPSLVEFVELLTAVFTHSHSHDMLVDR